MKIDGVILTHPFADATFFLFEVKTALVNIGNQRDGLRKIDMHGLVVGYILIEPIRVFDRAVLDACCTARALFLDDVARLFGQGDGKSRRGPLLHHRLQ
jgi:hypothetical protein